MNNTPNKWQIWALESPLFGHTDWFMKAECSSEEELAESLKRTMIDFRDGIDSFNKYVKVKAFRNKHEIKNAVRHPPSIARKHFGSWIEECVSMMKKCENCVMRYEDDLKNGGWLCNQGKPWFKTGCKYHTPFGYGNAGEDGREYMPIIREAMKDELEKPEAGGMDYNLKDLIDNAQKQRFIERMPSPVHGKEE